MQLDVKIDGIGEMDELELLGSRYLKPEQVMLGPVQTFRAQSAATWREVYIHRVSTTEESLEQAKLLKLLTTALVRSSETKRLVLDFGEEQGFWNVVTDCEPQCENLREWLQSEVDTAHKGAGMLTAEQAAALGEFARLFARGAQPQLSPPRRPALPAPAPVPVASPPAPPEDLEVEVTEAEVSEPATSEVIAETVEPVIEEPPAVSEKANQAASPPAWEVSSPVETNKGTEVFEPPIVMPPPFFQSAVKTGVPVYEAAERTPVAEVMRETPIIFPAREMEVVDMQPEVQTPIFATSMPKPARNTKLVNFFIILGVLALILIMVIIFLSMHS